MRRLRLTHVAHIEGMSGYYIRFAGGDSESWNAFKDKLKSSDYALWRPKFTFNDGKIGAWYVDDVYLFACKDNFYNYEYAMSRGEEHENPIRDSAKQSSQDERSAFIPSRVKGAVQTLALVTDKLPSVEELKKQYRTMALKNHPDIGGDVEQMKAINAANIVVLDWLKTTLAEPSF